MSGFTPARIPIFSISDPAKKVAGHPANWVLHSSAIIGARP
jgi:hypothetical protein